MEVALLSYGLTFVIVIVTFFIYRGLRNSQSVSWAKIAIGISLILLCCGVIIVEVINDWGFVAYIQILLGSGAAVLSGVSFVVVLDRWRKLGGLIIAIGIPLTLYASLEVGFPYSPNEIIHRNGEEIARALNNYYVDSKAYPQTLSELVPNYLSDLKEPKSIWGWLYVGNDDDFTLGYVSYVDKMGYTICKYSKKTPKWDCPLDYSTAPFHLEPTPMP
jgi:hypothetical protein